MQCNSISRYLKFGITGKLRWPSNFNKVAQIHISKLLYNCNYFFLLIFGENHYFLRPLIPLFCTSGDICPGFQSHYRFPCLNSWSAVYNGFLRFTSGVTPADLLMTSMVVEPFQSIYLHTSIGGSPIQDQACHCLTACNKVDALLNWAKAARHNCNYVIRFSPFWLRFIVMMRAIVWEIWVHLQNFRKIDRQEWGLFKGGDFTKKPRNQAKSLCQKRWYMKILVNRMALTTLRINISDGGFPFLDPFLRNMKHISKHCIMLNFKNCENMFHAFWFNLKLICCWRKMDLDIQQMNELFTVLNFIFAMRK